MALLNFIFFPILAFALEQKCSLPELKDRNCILKTDNVKINIREQSLFLLAKQKIQILPNPFSSSMAEWKEIRLKKISEHLLLEFLSWDTPGNDGAQSLVYTAYGIQDQKIQLLISDRIQRRFFNSKTKQFSYGPLESFKIELGSNKKLIFAKGKNRQALAFP